MAFISYQGHNMYMPLLGQRRDMPLQHFDQKAVEDAALNPIIGNMMKAILADALGTGGGAAATGSAQPEIGLPKYDPNKAKGYVPPSTFHGGAGQPQESEIGLPVTPLPAAVTPPPAQVYGNEFSEVTDRVPMRGYVNPPLPQSILNSLPAPYMPEGGIPMHGLQPSSVSPPKPSGYRSDYPTMRGRGPAYESIDTGAPNLPRVPAMYTPSLIEEDIQIPEALLPYGFNGIARSDYEGKLLQGRSMFDVVMDAMMEARQFEQSQQPQQPPAPGMTRADYFKRGRNAGKSAPAPTPKPMTRSDYFERGRNKGKTNGY